MARVIPIEDVRYTPAVAVFEGRGDAPVSFYVTEFERGEGTPLHLHPYPEVFLVERNVHGGGGGADRDSGPLRARARQHPPPLRRG